MRWAIVSGMLMVRGEMCGCTGFTGDSGASGCSLFSLDRAVNVILIFVLGNLKVHLENRTRQSIHVCDHQTLELPRGHRPFPLQKPPATYTKAFNEQNHN